MDFFFSFFLLSFASYSIGCVRGSRLFVCLLALYKFWSSQAQSTKPGLRLKRETKQTVALGRAANLSVKRAFLMNL
jgi:hypothetical protein